MLKFLEKINILENYERIHTAKTTSKYRIKFKYLQPYHQGFKKISRTQWLAKVSLIQTF